MMGGEVAKNWTRFKEYFEVWISLVDANSFVRHYCEDVKMVEKILDFILEEYSPFTKGSKKYSLHNMHYSA